MQAALTAEETDQAATEESSSNPSAPGNPALESAQGSDTDSDSEGSVF